MRKLTVLILFFFCSQYLLAQTQTKHKVDPKKLIEFLNKKNTESSKKFLDALRLLADTARYDSKVLQGDVYLLPQGNMPCLVPDSNTYVYNNPQLLLRKSQPNLQKNDTLLIGQVPSNEMPNAYRGRPFVWKKNP